MSAPTTVRTALTLSGVVDGSSNGPGTPLPDQRFTDMPRRFRTSVAGLCPDQLISCVSREPKKASGSTPSSSVAVPSTMVVASACAAGLLSMSGAPEKEATDENRSGCRAA